MASFLVFSLFEDMARGNIDFDNDTFYMMLILPSWTPVQTVTKRSDLTSVEVADASYTAGGLQTTVSVSRTGAVTGLTFSNVIFPTLANGVQYARAAVYKRRGGAATADELVGVLDFGSTQTADGSNVTVNFTNALNLTIPTGV